MAEIKTLALPAADIEYDSNNEAVTRRTIEQAIESINTKISNIQKLQDSVTSKSAIRKQFLLMGIKHG
tara:strand:+ start:753 stop:956 length:204 start_codon:yes stop_codon:yes gene_type:complete